MRRPMLFAILALTPGCCFIGCDEKVLFAPKSTVIVTDADGNPVPDAVVTLARYEENPHFRPIEDWSSKVGPDGRTTFEQKRGTVTQYPLMMHGVGSFAWQFCAEAPGRQTQVKAWHEREGGDAPVEVTIQLPKGQQSDPCSEVVQFEPLVPSPVLRCATDADCTYATLDEACCELCYGRIVTVAAKSEQEQDCAGTAPATCEPCEVPVARDNPPRCLAGTCRVPELDSSG